MGKGRVVPDEATKLKLFKFHKNVFKASMFLVVPYTVFWGLLCGVTLEFLLAVSLPVIVLTLLVFIRQHCLVRHLAKHAEKLSFKESLSKSAAALPDCYYWLLALASLLVIAFAIYMPYGFNKPYAELQYSVTGFSSFGLLLFSLSLQMYRAKHTVID